VNGGRRQERSLIDGFLQGDPATLRALDAWILPVVRHRAWKLRELEEDLLQEVRLRLLKLFEAGTFRGDAALKTYVQATAKYTCLDAVRRARIRRTEELREEHFPLSRDHPAEDLRRWDEARLCRLVLVRLPERCRRLLRLVLERELSYEEIAGELAISLGTVKSRLARCRDRAVLLRGELLAIREEGAEHG
jgi:RNA polymerase sigma-70 factor (ECF subfamily)